MTFIKTLAIAAVVGLLAGCVGGREPMSDAQQRQFIAEQEQHHQAEEAKQKLAVAQPPGGSLEQIEAETGTTAADNEERDRDRIIAAAQFMEASQPYRLNGLTGATIIATSR